MNDNVVENVVNELARPEDVLPGVLHLLPLEKKPFFPAQVLPLVLDVRRWSKTLKAIHKADQSAVGVVFTDGVKPEAIESKDFRSVGTVCKIHHIEQQEDQYHVVLAGLQRFEITNWVSEKRPFTVQVRYFPELSPAESTEIKAYTTAIVNIIKELLPLNPMYGEELKMFLNYFRTGEPARLADFGASLTTADAVEMQEILETIELLPRMEKTLVLLQKEVEVAKAQTEIRAHIEGEITQHQREMFLREQLKFIQKELGISKDDRESEVETFRGRLEGCVLPEQAQSRIDEELDKLSMLERGSPEYGVTRNYLDWLTSVPWGKHSKDSLVLKNAAVILDRDHEGLDEVKQRILEFIGAGKMKGKVAGSIMLLVGPPGVGKTSLGRSVADALGREFFRFSLGGMRDEAEIKGHRRTYIGAMPGKFVQALRECKTANPVIMLDEIDKIGDSFRGDPASALLEVLDPEQNKDFLDHYLDVRVDLSNVLFICTANQLDTIPAPLLDRMESIRLSGYLAAEKIVIARKHLLPRQLQRVGLKKRGQLRIDTLAMRKIVERYAREAGVRRLEKMLGTITRKAVMRLLKKNKAPIHVTVKNLEQYLGKPIFNDEDRIAGVGVVTGLAWTAMGGTTLDIEATRSHSFNRGFKLTGQLGDVMKESAEIAYSYVLGNAEQFGIDQTFFKNAMIHLHVPAGATPKDGPSAGITMACALISLAKGRAIKKSIAMTGEISLTGQVLPVGGIKEKVIAARRMKIRNLILPEANRGDYEDLPDYITKGIKANFVSRYPDVVAHLF
ncbi:endopeptidase La [Candidatus Spongiihabitans sp.]|uniref:endopeptidase La n=1 Tax=Candidatus Spongiihabitans sp. TaxID=3101308 RepID=UPI003C6FCD90